MPAPLPKEELFRKGPRNTVIWGGKSLDAEKAKGSFYRICGVTGSGKTHLTKLFLLEILRELEDNPKAKLIVYEPKREFYAWFQSLKETYDLKSPIRYFMPSDKRSVSLAFEKDYRSDQDSRTFAHAFYPEGAKEQNRFWGDSLRTIYAAIYDTIRRKLCRVDMRLMCLVMENPRYIDALLRHNPYHLPARNLVIPPNSSGQNETATNILMTINSRIAEMKVLAAHLEANKKNGSFSIREFIREPNQGVLVVSKDADYHLVQDPMNGVFFYRLMQLLDKEQQEPGRKVYIVIDEFPTLAGDNPCPGIKDMFLRLRSRGVCLLIAYQGFTTLKSIYGEDTKGILGQCSNIVYLRQPDPESAEFASQDLGSERGREGVRGTSISDNQAGVSTSQEYFDRAKHSPTQLLDLFPASPERGIEGYGKSGAYHEKEPWPIAIAARYIDNQIPRPLERIKEYDEWEESAQRIGPLTDGEKFELFPEMYLDE